MRGSREAGNAPSNKMHSIVVDTFERGVLEVPLQNPEHVGCMLAMRVYGPDVNRTRTLFAFMSKGTEAGQGGDARANGDAGEDADDGK